MNTRSFARTAPFLSAVAAPLTLCCCILMFAFSTAYAQEAGELPVQQQKLIPAGSKVFVAPMKDGFDTFLIAGLIKKKVPLVIVNSRGKADFEITGVSESEKAGWAKMLFSGSDQSREQASIKVVDVKTGEVVFAYSVNKGNSVHGKQSSGEACAKHLKDRVKEH